MDEHASQSSLSQPIEIEGDHALITGERLWQTLGYTSAAAFRQAKKRGKACVPLFKLEGRRGIYAWRADVQNWLDRVKRDRSQTLGAIPNLKLNPKGDQM